MVAAKTLDYVLNGVEEYIGVTIISSQFTEVRDMITKKLGRGVTVYNGELTIEETLKSIFNSRKKLS